VSVAALVCVGCAKKNPVAAGGTGTITGTVCDSSGGAALVAADISTQPATSNALTDSAGRFTIAAVAAGSYIVTARKAGFIIKSVPATVTDGATATVAIMLRSGNNAPPVPSHPTPADSATGLATKLLTMWTCTDPDPRDTVRYDVYFGLDNPPASIISAGQAPWYLQLSGLAHSSTYYWKIVATDNHGSVTEGPVWRFTTYVPQPIDWVTITAGEFAMGSLPGDPYAGADEQPQHSVYLDGYQISRYEITNGQFKLFIDAGGYTNSSYWTTEGWTWRTAWNYTAPSGWSSGSGNQGEEHPGYPIDRLSWYEADAFCRWAGYRMPTEAEWEKAARGTDGWYWPWGNTWDAGRCNTNLNVYPDGYVYTSPVGFFTDGVSPYGMYDMIGNVMEWCGDWYQDDYYVASPDSNPTGPSAGTQRVVRGACWNTMYEYYYRCAVRPRGTPDTRCGGLRPVRLTVE